MRRQKLVAGGARANATRNAFRGVRRDCVPPCNSLKSDSFNHSAFAWTMAQTTLPFCQFAIAFADTMHSRE